jgi:hypothetical protein
MKEVGLPHTCANMRAPRLHAPRTRHRTGVHQGRRNRPRPRAVDYGVLVSALTVAYPRACCHLELAQGYSGYLRGAPRTRGAAFLSFWLSWGVLFAALVLFQLLVGFGAARALVTALAMGHRPSDALALAPFLRQEARAQAAPLQVRRRQPERAIGAALAERRADARVALPPYVRSWPEASVGGVGPCGVGPCGVGPCGVGPCGIRPMWD